MKAFLIKRIRLSWTNAKRTHSYWLKKSEGLILLLIALIIWLPLSQQLLSDDIKLGISFFIAGFMAIYSGAIYRDERVMGIVVVGVFLATIVPQLLFDAWTAFQFSDWISAIVLFGFAIYLWYWSGEMKRGRLLNESKPRKVRRGKRAISRRYKRR